MEGEFKIQSESNIHRISIYLISSAFNTDFFTLKNSFQIETAISSQYPCMERESRRIPQEFTSQTNKGILLTDRDSPEDQSGRGKHPQGIGDVLLHFY